MREISVNPMTKIVLALCLAAISLSTQADAAVKRHPRWMFGHWAWVSPKEALRRGDCPESEFYGGNGYVVDGESVSRWWIEGVNLVRVTVKPGYGEPNSAAGRTYRQRFTRNGPDKLIFRRDGYVQWLIRCEDVPPGWEYPFKR
jgi:hypothetical protein